MLPRTVEIGSADAVADALSFVPCRIPRPRTSDLGKPLTEWWMLRRLLQRYPDGLPFDFPFVIEKGERPDFIIKHNDMIYYLEVTEATSHLDQHAWATTDRTKPHLVSEFGGRAEGGMGGNQPERLVIADVLRAIRRKRKLSRDLSPRCLNLLIYINSEPGLLFDIECFAATIEDYWPLLDVSCTNYGDIFAILGKSCWLDIRGNKARIIRAIDSSPK